MSVFNNVMDRRISLKNKFKKRQMIFAAWTSLYHLSIVEAFARIDPDFIGIDIEHSTISLEQSQDIISTAQANDTLCLPRIATHDQEAVKRLLDSGADGVIVPMVSSLAQAEEIVSWVKYPPKGKRSYGVARAQGYGLDFEKYVEDWNENSIVIPQIENAEGIKNINEILSCEGVDGVMVGPYDISGSLGIPGQIDHPDVKDACSKVIKSCKEHGKSCGTHIIFPDNDNVRETMGEEYTFFILSSDVFMLRQWVDKMNDIIAEIKK